MRVDEGALSVVDLVSRSYLHELNHNVWLVSSMQYMPINGEDKSFIERIVSIMAAVLYPLSLSLLLPVFMHNLVLEKEERLVQMMKMNGMRMRDYWLVTIAFYFLLCFFTYITFYLFAYHILALDFFVDTDPFTLVTKKKCVYNYIYVLVE